MSKTNAMRILDRKKIEYKYSEYDYKDGLIDGLSVAKKIARDPKEVYKTLLCQGDMDYYIFVIPVEEELDLKKSAKLLGEKKIYMVDVEDIERLTGYVRGGCSPIGMKKHYKTYIQEDGKLLEEIVVSAGRIGSQIILDPKDLKNLSKAKFVNIIK